MFAEYQKDPWHFMKGRVTCIYLPFMPNDITQRLKDRSSYEC